MGVLLVGLLLGDVFSKKKLGCYANSTFLITSHYVPTNEREMKKKTVSQNASKKQEH